MVSSGDLIRLKLFIFESFIWLTLIKQKNIHFFIENISSWVSNKLQMYNAIYIIEKQLSLNMDCSLSKLLFMQKTIINNDE